MRYEIDENNYITAVYFNCNSGTCTEYTGTIPDGYTSLEEWASNAHIQAYKIVEGNLVYDSDKDAELQEQWAIEEENNKPELKGNKVTSIDITNTDTQYPSAKAVFDALQSVELEGVTAFYKEYKSTYITTENNTIVIPINIFQYRSGIDLLTVYINGFQLIEGTDYTKGTNSITLTKAIEADNTIHFVVLRSVVAKTEDYDLLKGEAGLGVPAGGTIGQILAKSSDADNDTKWINAPSGTNINVVDNLESTSATDALSANQGRLLREEINNFSSKTTIYEGILSGGSSVVLSNIKRFIDVYFLVALTAGNQIGKYTIDTGNNLNTIAFSGCVLPALDNTTGLEYYVSESSFNKGNNTFTHTKAGYFSISNRSYTDKKGSQIYYVYRIDTYD
jgi:hypothetical protein